MPARCIGNNATMRPDDVTENPGAIRMAAAHTETHSETGAIGDTHTAADSVSLFADADDLDRRWTDIQADFVDDPRRAIEEADQLVAEVMGRVTDRLAEQRAMLEATWQDGDGVDTEQLRLALRHYRSFFERLLAT